MKICAAQTNSLRGKIEANIENHIRFIKQANEHQTDLIVFPELSLTGYEPELAGGLAMTPDDSRLDDFQKLSDMNNMTIGVGMPLRHHPRPMISMVVFRPNRLRQVYSKQYIHADEEPYFVNGQIRHVSLPSPPNIALAICYEIAVSQHAETAHRNGADLYLASVVKTVDGTAKAHERLADIALTYSMTVMMANCVGVSDGELCGGRSAVWNNTGSLLGHLNDTDEGILIFDTNTQAIIARQF